MTPARVAVALVAKYGVVEAHWKAYARGHSYRHFGMTSRSDWARLFWRKVAFCIRVAAPRERRTMRQRAELVTGHVPYRRTIV